MVLEKAGQADVPHRCMDPTAIIMTADDDMLNLRGSLRMDRLNGTSLYRLSEDSWMAQSLPNSFASSSP